MLKVMRDGRVIPVCFPLGTIVLDTFLLQDRESGRRRFTIAHEIAHHVLDRHNPMPQFHRIYDSEKEYTIQELKAHLTMTESQADRLAAAILMPRFTVLQALQDFNKGQKVKVYGQAVYANEDRKVIRKMASQAGVSFAAMQIRLQELDLLEFHPLDEYVEERILGGKQDEQLFV
jgi:Zn-dependent peptidase ImmA (M78 family)